MVDRQYLLSVVMSATKNRQKNYIAMTTSLRVAPSVTGRLYDHTSVFKLERNCCRQENSIDLSPLIYDSHRFYVVGEKMSLIRKTCRPEMVSSVVKL